MRNKNRPVRDAAIRLVGGFGLHVGERTRRDEIERLIAALRPLDCGVELVRLGPDGDGGYLVPDDLEGIGFAFSPGVSTESGFEAALAERGMKVFLADHSVDGPASAHPNLLFRRKHVGCVSDDVHTTLDAWKSDVLPDQDGDLLLQMDVEGAEIETLLAASDALLRQFRILVVEFHFLQNLFDRAFFQIASRAFDKLLKHHGVVHIHPNNCCGSVHGLGVEIPRVAEITFLRNDRFRRREPRSDFPHRLDRDNTGKAPLPLPRCWYR